VLRGGNWNNNANNARCAYRNHNNPNNANNNIGFRCVRGIREEAGGNPCPLRAGGVRKSTDFRSVPSESPPDAACFPEFCRGTNTQESSGLVAGLSVKTPMTLRVNQKVFCNFYPMWLVRRIRYNSR
jgi:hypothetical protein